MSIARAISSLDLQSAGAITNVKVYGAICNNSTDDTTAIIAACAAAYAGSFALYFPSVSKITADIPLFHDVQKRGPGGVQVSGSRVFRAEPNVLVSTFSARQTIYVDVALGNDTNAGLGAGALAVASIAGAKTILTKYGQLNGNWSLTFAAGTYSTTAQFFQVSNDRYAPIYIEGPTPASVWDNTSAPADSTVTGGSVPTAIFQGPGDDSGWCFDFQSACHVVLRNLKGIGWGTLATGKDEGFARVENRGSLTATNCHIWSGSAGLCSRGFSGLVVQGGIYHGLRQAFYTVAGCRYELGYGQSSAGQTGAALIRQCTFGLDCWEGSTGHPDYAIFEDNGTHVFLRKNAHGAFRGPTFRNTGSNGASVAIRIQESGSYNLDGSEVWTGTHSPRIYAFNGANNVNEFSYQDRLLAWNYADQTTSGTTQLAIASLVIPKAEFAKIPQCLIAKAGLTLVNPNATVALTLRGNGTFITSATIPISAGTYFAVARIEMACTGSTNGNTQRVGFAIDIANAGGTVTKVMTAYADTAMDFTTAAVTLTLNVTCSNASDSVTCRTAEIWRRG